MATARFNAFLFKALSNTSIHGTVSTSFVSTRQFAKTSATKSAKPTKPAKSTKSSTKTTEKAPKKTVESKPKKPKKPTKKEEKLQKLLKQYPDPSAPKRPITSYFRFCADYRKKHSINLSSETMISAAKQTSAAWRQLPDAQKSQYTQKAAADRKKYKIAQEAYNSTNKEALWLDKITKLSQDKPPQNGYKLFIKKRLPQVKEQNPMAPIPQILSMTAGEWSELTPQQKKQWTDKAKTKYAEWERKLL